MYLTTNGISTYCERRGAGPAVVLVHALGTSVRSWDPLVQLLPDSYETIAYDWRGHGRSEKTVGEYSLPMLARDLADLLTRCAVEKACIVGVAVGAMIALQTALDYPEKVGALLLAEGASEMDPSAAEYTANRAARVEREGMRVAVDMTIERAFPQAFIEANPDTIAQFRGEFLANAPHGYASSSRVVLGLNLTPRLHEIHCPTLLLVGELDRLLPPPASMLIQSRIPGSRLEIMPGVGHFSYVEAPKLFAKRLLALMGELHGQPDDSNGP